MGSSRLTKLFIEPSHHAMAFLLSKIQLKKDLFYGGSFFVDIVN